MEEIKLIFEDEEILGFGYITNYRLVLKLDKPKKYNNKEYFKSLPNDYFDIPLFFINKLEKFPDKKFHSKYLLELATKDQRNIKFSVFSDEKHSKHFYNILCKLIYPKDFLDFLKYTIRYRENHPVNNDGWKLYKMKEEFKRQGVRYENSFKSEIGKNSTNVVTIEDVSIIFIEILF